MITKGFLNYVLDATADALSTFTLPGQKSQDARAKELADRRNKLNLQQYDKIVKDNFELTIMLLKLIQMI